MPALSAADVVAVITSYNPSSSILAACTSVSGQVARVVVVDDGSDGSVDILDQCAALGCTVVRLAVNSGIAAALNAGVAEATNTAATNTEATNTEATNANGTPSFVLTLDQDSRVGPTYVSELLAAWSSALAAGVPVAMVAPETVEGLPTRVRTVRGSTLIGDEPIQSGLLIAADTLARLGPFLEPLFIDGVDTEFFLRGRAAGLETIVARGARVSHSLGDRHYPTIFGRRIVVAGSEVGLVRSAPFRYYYIARNHVHLLREYGRTQRRWAIRETFLDLRHFAVVLVLIPGRWRRLRLIVMGVLDGLRRVSGKMPERAAALASGR
ncbi:MAG: rhamnosyltransferase [Microbacteriaceae bacterium]|nr:rhamnosyltransferase [Microbacteriaceae bacterium]